jgi:hypothetical protein
VGPNGFRPSGRTFALRRRRRYTVAAQHIADHLIGDMISQFGERPDNPVIAPGIAGTWEGVSAARPRSSSVDSDRFARGVLECALPAPPVEGIAQVPRAFVYFS